MAEQGHVTYHCFASPGVLLDLEIGAFGDHYTAAVTLNGVRTRVARRRTLADALRWGRRVAGEQISLLGLSPAQLALPAEFASSTA